MEEQAKTELHDLFVEVIKMGFNSIKARAKDEYLYGFALQISSGDASFICVGNTLDSVTDKFMTELTSIEDVTDYLWFTTEWQYKFDPFADGSSSAPLIEEKRSLLAIVNANEYLEILLKALQTCNVQHMFGMGILREKMAVFIDSEDGDELDLSERTSECLNPPYVHEAFLKRFEPNNSKGLTYRLIDGLVADY